MIEILNDILLSENVCEKFYIWYEKPDFRAWLLNVLPEVEACRNLKQDNPWHIYNCLDHILHSVEEINKLSVSFDQKTRKTLAYTMFLHDIGKPDCKIRRFSKLYNREVDSFFKHNLLGVKIAERVLRVFGFDEKSCEIIKKLIEMHDIFMFISLEPDGNPYHKVLTQELIREEVEKLNLYGDGKELFKMLLLVGKADNLAQNPQMTQNSLIMIDKIGELFDKSMEL